MAYDRSVRNKVRASYVQIGVLTSAAQLHDVPYNTARTWKRQDADAGHDWDIQRQAHHMSKSGVESMVNAVLGKLAEQFLATLAALEKDEHMKPDVRAKILVQLMDGYGKAISSSSRATPNSNRLATAMDVIRYLTSVFTDKAPKLRTEFVNAVELLGDDLVREFGGNGATR